MMLLPLLFAAAATWTGNESCRPCHPHIVETYSRTPMAQSSGRVLSTPPGSFTHKPSRSTYTISADANVSLRSGITRHLDWFIGSGSAGRSFVYSFNGYLFQAPVTWYTERAAWDVSPGYERDTSTRWNRPVDANCLFCHASQTRPIYGTANRFADPPIAQPGVACERCHGPASEHIASVGKVHPVNPARLPPARRDSICSQCHLSGEARIDRAGTSAAMFRAGSLLSDYVSVFVTPSGNNAVRATGYVEKLEQSACKRASGDKLWCGTCHDPHQVPEPRVAAAYFREKCLGCHTTQQCNRGPDCRTCHMPRARAADGGHGVLTDHNIRRAPLLSTHSRPAAAGPPATLVPFRGFEANPRELGLAWAEVGDPTQALAILSSLPNLDAPAKARLADLYSRSGDTARALTLYREAYGAGLRNPLVLVNLGTLEAQRGNLPRAKELWTAALKQNPGLFEAAINLERAAGHSVPEADTAKTLAAGNLP